MLRRERLPHHIVLELPLPLSECTRDRLGGFASELDF